MELKRIDRLLPNNSQYGYSTISDDSTVVHISERYDSKATSMLESNKKRRILAIWGIIISSIIFVFIFRTPNKLQLGFVFDRTMPYKQVVHPEQPSPLWGSVVKPYPTGAFWTNFVIKNGDGVVGCYPYGVKLLDGGIQVSYGASRRVVTQLSVTDPFNIDLQISATQPLLSRAVESYDNSSVTMTYKLNNGGKFKSHIVKGAPFITTVYDNATPIISSDVMLILEVEPKMIKNSDGVQYIVTLGNFQRWLVFCSESIVFSWKENSLIANSAIKGYVRVAYLPSIGYLEAYNALIPYLKKYPTAAVWTFNYPSGNIVEVNVQYITNGTGPLLMYALPHHVPIMQIPNPKGEDALLLQKVLYPIYTVKGKLKAVIGEQWKLVYNLVQVGWHFVPSEKLTNSQMDEIAKHLIVDVAEVMPPVTDPYGFGKQIGRMARLALIADEFGIPTVRQQAILNLETALTPWLTGVNPNPLLYDKTWGGLVPSHGLESFINEFGSGWYSDHHFHYGYFVYALATLAMLDPPYWAANRPAIETIVRDICNPDSSDPDFPFFRHKDLFDGHSWASGLFQQGNGKGQESSSESINAYYGAYLYGLVTGNTELTRVAHAILTMEVHATKVYWHMTDSSLDMYDPIFAANRMLGNIGAIDITASTWFGSKFEFVHGINMMPLTPITSELFDQQYVMKQWPVLGSRLKIEHKEVPDKYRKCSANKDCMALGLLGNCCPNQENVFLQCCNYTADALGIDMVSDEYKGYIYADQAVVDRDNAWASILSHTSFGSGGSKTNSLYWAASRPPPPSNYTPQLRTPDYPSLIPASCAANSACNAIGLYGACCPLPAVEGSTTPPISLGCCSQYVILKPWGT